MIDEAFFWEHAYRYDSIGRAELFVDIFKYFPPAELTQGFIERDLLPWVEGRYRQAGTVREFELDLDFDTSVFTSALNNAFDGCANIQDVWHVLVKAYAHATRIDDIDSCDVLIKSADYGMSILAGVRLLSDVRCICILRNPYFALDSLKRSRQIRGHRHLNPFNFGEALRDYIFFWEHQDKINVQETFTITYEELLSDPEKMMRAVTDHLGIRFTRNLIQPTLAGGEWPGLSSFQETRAIDSGVLERPLQVLDEGEIRLIGKYLGDLLDQYGYTPKRQLPMSLWP